MTTTRTLALAGWRFHLVLALLLWALLALVPPSHSGDVAEYSLETIAVASHGSADIRLEDIARARQLVPQMRSSYDVLEADMRANKPDVYPAFARGRDGKVYSIHFVGYPALAALPFKAFDLLGLPPLKCYQALNLAAIYLLGLCLLRFFKSPSRALLGLGLFMLCGGALYWNWSSPECVSAAALLSAMLLAVSGAPVAAGVLAGLAAQQNPTIVFFFAFAPLLQLCLQWRRGAGVRANLSGVPSRGNLLGLAAGIALAALPVLFNLHQFGVPNIIAERFSDPGLIGPIRLASFYFDLNQGMVIALPGVLAALALWGWRGQVRRAGLLLGICALFTLALALPALAVINWNSGAAGVMRYGFWAAMPFLFALLVRLRDCARWPLALLLGIGVVQAASMLHASSYSYIEFSPLARLVLKHTPALYHPEPEIFGERVMGNDNYIEAGNTYVYKEHGVPVKTLAHGSGIDAALCGPAARLSPDTRSTASDRGWRYIDGPVRCVGGVSRH